MSKDASQNNQIGAIEKAIGNNESEEYLRRICDRTFLSLWSHVGVFRDDRKLAGGDGKEVCDLLVVFGNHIIIFSDKNCEFPNSGDLELDWRRWYKRAINASVKQLRGAENWIREFPDRLFLDRRCTNRFPIPLPDMATARFHRVIVAHGASARCRKELGGSGSLFLAPAIVGPQHHAEQQDVQPFAIGQVMPEHGYFHVFDDTSLDIVLNTVDTISDFARYLGKKEEFISSGKLVVAAGEEELLAYYCANYDYTEGYRFTTQPEIASVVIEEGVWKDYISSEQRVSQCEANQISYEWDRLIELVSGGVLKSQLHPSSDTEFLKHERRLRVMAKESRTSRRALATAYTEFIEASVGKDLFARVVCAPNGNETCYVFVALASFEPRSEYRELRQNILRCYCMAAKLENLHAADVIGIATETRDSEIRSEDICCIYADLWTPELQAEAEQMQAKLSLLKNSKTRQIQVLEFPSDDPTFGLARMPKRNWPCPCGSNRRFKKCCGK